MDLTQRERLADELFREQARAPQAKHAKRQRSCAEAGQVREAVMIWINPPFTAQDYWNSYAEGRRAQSQHDPLRSMRHGNTRLRYSELRVH